MLEAGMHPSTVDAGRARAGLGASVSPLCPLPRPQGLLMPSCAVLGLGYSGGLQHGGPHRLRSPRGPTVMLWGREVMLRGCCGAEGAPLRCQEVFLHAPNLKIGLELVVPGQFLGYLPPGV